MWDAADIAALIDPDLPGYALGTKADLSTIDGLLREPYGEAFGMVGGSDPSYICAESAAPDVGSALTIDAVAYTVKRRKRDGHGLMTLDLETP